MNIDDTIVTPAHFIGEKALAYLIDKGQMPDANKEYIVTVIDLPCARFIGDRQQVKKGTVITNVTAKVIKDGTFLGYDFIVKETGKAEHTNYAWAIAEHTPENLLRIAEYDAAVKEKEAMEKKVELLRKKIVTL